MPSFGEQELITTKKELEFLREDNKFLIKKLRNMENIVLSTSEELQEVKDSFAERVAEMQIRFAKMEEEMEKGNRAIRNLGGNFQMQIPPLRTPEHDGGIL
jgi:hypothetical protein